MMALKVNVKPASFTVREPALSFRQGNDTRYGRAHVSAVGATMSPG